MATRCQCEVISESVSGEFTQPCGQTNTLYQASSLPTAPTGTLSVRVSNTTCTVTVTILEANGDSITRIITPSSGTLLPLTVTISRIASITVTCSGGTGTAPTCTIRWDLVYHYCKCCRV